MTPRPARNHVERQLEQVQVHVTRGQLAERTRTELILRCYEAGMTQPEIAARLTRAAHRVGGPPVTVSTVEHIIRRFRDRR